MILFKTSSRTLFNDWSKFKNRRGSIEREGRGKWNYGEREKLEQRTFSLLQVLGPGGVQFLLTRNPIQDEQIFVHWPLSTVFPRRIIRCIIYGLSLMAAKMAAKVLFTVYIFFKSFAIFSICFYQWICHKPKKIYWVY